MTIPEDVKAAAETAIADAKANITLEALQGASNHGALVHETYVDAIARAILTDREARTGWRPPGDCDGKEQLAFEAWASSERYDMREHPLHYLFMDAKTYAARQGWKAALRYVREQFAASPSPLDKTEGEEEGGELRGMAAPLTRADQQRLRHNDLERNQIINQACTDLEDIINGHDPEIHNLGHRVWDRLDKLAMSVESRITSALLLEAGKALEDLLREHIELANTCGFIRVRADDLHEVVAARSTLSMIRGGE